MDAANVAGTSADGDDRGLSRRELVSGGAVLGGAVLVLAACGSSDKGGGAPGKRGTTELGPTAGIPSTKTRGGTLQVGYVGSGRTEVRDFNKTDNNIDSARAAQAYEQLFSRARKDQTPSPQLAVGATPDASGRVWTIELIQDAMWHDGKPFTSADVAYTLSYIADPKSEAYGASLLGGVKHSDIVTRDKYTLEVTLPVPNFMFPDNLASPYIFMMQDGTTAEDLMKRPVGTGEFKADRYVQGRTETFVRNDDFRDSDLPYLDGVEILSIADPSARVNGLLGGQLDVATEVTPSLVSRLENASDVKILETLSGTMATFFMRTQTAPFDDVRVRQAMRLVVDRQRIVDNVYFGHARIGNDLSSPTDPMYAEMPQREHDPERARSLLKEAGQENLKFELATAEITPGLVDMATLFAEQAAQIGVTVTIKKFTTDDYFTRGWINYPMGTTRWTAYPLSQQIAQSLASDAPFKETDWNNEEFNRLWEAAKSEGDDAKRKDLLVEAQKILYDEGGYVIPAFLNNVSAVRSSVSGVEEGSGYPLGHADFRETAIDS